MAFFIAVREPGCIPVKKRPPVDTIDGAIQMLRELVACRPAGTHLTLIETSADMRDIYVSCGLQEIAMDEACKPRRKRKSRSALPSPEQQHGK